MDSFALPRHTGPVDHLRYGFESLQTETGPRHPVDVLQRQASTEWTMKLDNVRRIYGSHLAMRLATEKAMLSRPHRLPGLASSNLGRDVVLGISDRIEFADYLNDPLTRPTASKVSLHDVMEVKLGMR